MPLVYIRISIVRSRRVLPAGWNVTDIHQIGADTLSHPILSVLGLLRVPHPYHHNAVDTVSVRRNRVISLYYPALPCVAVAGRMRQGDLPHRLLQPDDPTRWSRIEVSEHSLLSIN